MISESLRKRIAALNRVHLGDTPSKSRRELKNRLATSREARRYLSIRDAVGGREMTCGGGCFLVVEPTLNDLIPDCDEAFTRHYLDAVCSIDVDRLLEDEKTFSQGRSPEDLLYIDLETTGFTSGTPLFLAGVLLYENGNLVVRQLLARDYSEEPHVLNHLAELIGRSQVFVSFNGKSYDLPFVRDRMIFHGIKSDLRKAHVDILHHARRQWSTELPNCKLQTLERAICRRFRYGDIAGVEIPDAYHHFVRSQNAIQLRDILHHNALDLITMAELMIHLLKTQSTCQP